ncbi:hypothetical protein D5908_22655 [Salmonella enterica subsp. enterica serovar Ealing]|nr:hypothetical protein [Salmonella enterica]EBY7079053.1 hypothetical protein [Salmonella enterica subsp. enterica serovar Ealing]ECU9348741.1 hypothetical protein [Salmonella enterica subsp. enterica serovar Oranienburg]MIY13506.1 hypothetical protein [Salmonella enterica subsp. enterica serovar Jangwani]EDO3599607.1 hypothetical protein [Salmonella enterica]
MLPGRGAPVRMKKIRDCLFPDLSEKREKNTYAEHIHMPDICICMACAYPHHLHMLNLYIC